MKALNKITLAFLVFTIFRFSVYGQSKNNSSISTIHEMEAAKNHYKSLSTLSPEKRKSYSSMDKVKNLPKDFTRFTLVYGLNKPYYLSLSQVDFIVKAVEHPANSSEQTRAELDFLLKLQSERNEKQTERVRELGRIGYWPALNYTKAHPKYKENEEDLLFMIHQVTGKNFTSDQIPFTTNLLKGVMHDTRLMEFAIKHNLLRVRPYRLDTRITPLSEIPTPSFVSGHTLWAYSIAFVMSELVPDKRSEYLNLAYEIGLSREIMGVHYPSDEEIARQVANRMLTLMWHTQKFQDDFVKAKKEWK